MEQRWSYKALKPTLVPTKEHQPRKMPPKEVQATCILLVLRAKDVIESCYSPLAWIERGDILSMLAYPELTAGDAYKAIRLCNAGLSSDNELSIKVRLEVGMMLMLEDPGASCWSEMESDEEARFRVVHRLEEYQNRSYKVLLSALSATQTFHEALDICKRAQTLYPYDDSFMYSFKEIETRLQSKKSMLLGKGMSEIEADTQMSSGCIRMRLYPWVPKTFLRRGPDLISDGNSVLKRYSNCLEIRASPIGDPSTATNNQEDARCLGYFATRNIAQGELVLSAPTALGVCSRQTTTRCYNCSGALPSLESYGFKCCPMMRFCSSDCKKVATENYHKTLCGHDFKKIYEDAEMAISVHNPAIYSLFWLRLLACCVQQGGHPLEMPQMARLVAQYKLDVNVAWSLAANVASPLNILDSLGIDIFADSRYECWILETIWHRVKNNCSHYDREGVQCFNLNEHYSIFNHSCRFPPMITATGVTSTSAWTALCRIRKGEEVFTTYLGGATGASRETRQKMLLPWLDQACACDRCKLGN